MNSFDNFNEEQLPNKDCFYSQLYEECITDNQHTRAKVIWDNFNIKTLGEYHDICLMTDVYLLTDVFKNFRDMCMNYYGLDPAHYITLPNYSWSAFLSLTGIKLQQIHNKDMYEMIENGLRGGMTQCSHKKVEAQNTYVLNYSDDDDDKGYILEVDLEYPNELHELHKDYPLAPKIISLSANMLSSVQQEIHKTYYEKYATDETPNKFILNDMDNKQYVFHISSLKFI